MPLAVWRIHRRIGMSGGLFVHALARETGRSLSPEEVARMQDAHAKAYLQYAPQVRPLPGAPELLAYLARKEVPHAIATSGYCDGAGDSAGILGVGPEIPIITRDQVAYAKPDPDLFLAAAEALGVPIEHSMVVGDSIWDLLAARRARALGIGLLSVGAGPMNCRAPGLTASTRTRRICWRT
jgi:HAD superfamily hydrolase (TIGR01549 family)